MQPRTYFITALMLMLSVPLQAAVSDSEFEALRAEFAALAQRLTALESENAELKAAASALK